MRIELAIAAVCAAVCAPVNAPAQAGAETNTTDIVEEIITEAVKVIEEEGWTAQDVGDAIRSLRGLYLRDNATRDGRRRWHGDLCAGEFLQALVHQFQRTGAAEF